MLTRNVSQAISPCAAAESLRSSAARTDATSTSQGTAHSNKSGAASAIAAAVRQREKRRSRIRASHRVERALAHEPACAGEVIPVHCLEHVLPMQMPHLDLFGPAPARLPQGLTYQREFLSTAEEEELLAAIATLALQAAQYKQFTAKRRVASFGGQYDFTHNRLEPAHGLPALFHPLREKVAQWLGVAPAAFAHTLIAEYQPGVQLGWHRDVPQFEIVVGVSLAGSAR